MKKVFCIIIAVIVGILLYASTLGCQTAAPLPTKPHTPEPSIDLSKILWDSWLRYDGNGGLGGDTKHFCGQGDPKKSDFFPYTILGAADVPVKRDGYTFQYWNTKKDGSGTTYYAGDVVQSIVDFESWTLYAIWEKNADKLPE